MKILALDSSGLVASVAVIEDALLTAEYTLCYKLTHSQTLLPMLDEVQRRINLDLNEIAAIAVSCGPGSFTGLRIGAATAKGLALALNKPIISVPTVDALAYNLCGTEKLVCPLMDARRNQVYTGLYTFAPVYKNSEAALSSKVQYPKLRVLKEERAVSITQVIADLNDRREEVIFLGDGVPVYREILEQELKIPSEYAPAHLSRQRAASVGMLALSYLAEGRAVLEDAKQHKPIYLRKSQAERVRLAKEGVKDV